MPSEEDAATPKVIGLWAKESHEFIVNRHMTRRHLKDAALTILDDAVQLAMTGPWKAWADAQPAQSVADITPESLLACGDPRIAALATLYAEIMALHESLERKRA